MTDRSRDALMHFLDWLGTKGVMPLATAQSRKATANKVLEILSDAEAADVTTLDVGEVMKRFQNLKGKNYSPGSLKTYQSRLTGTLDDFRRYVDNPMDFRTGAQKRAPRTKPAAASGAPQSKPTAGQTPHLSQPTAVQNAPTSAGIIPIPIRSDLVVHVQGIPFNLSRSEAQRVANVILALAIEGA